MGLKWGKDKKIDSLERQIKEMNSYITNQNQLNQAIYSLISTGQPLTKDSKIDDYIQKGFEGNTDVFGIFMKLAKKFTLPKHRIYVKQSDGQLKEFEDKDLKRLTTRPNFYQTYREFKMAWFLYRNTTGSAIVYAPKFEEGVNKGKINLDGLSMMPTQNVEIFTGWWREPIKSYKLDINMQYEISATDVWHERIVNLEQVNGEHFMGTSPLKVAMDIINMQNGGNSLASNMFTGGHPPGIVSKEVVNGSNLDTPKEQEKAFREHYKRKYVNNPEEINIPIFTLGKVNFTKLSYDSLRELQVLEFTEGGKRAICTALGVPSVLFGDNSSSTYNNLSEAAKAMWEDFLIPETEAYCEGFTNNILPAYGDNLVMKPVYDDIRVLQEDRERMARIYTMAFDKGAYTPNQLREKLGDDPIKSPEMDQHFIPMNLIPINEINITEDQSNKWYDNNNLKDKL